MMDKLNIGTVLVFLLLVIAVFFAVRAIQKGKTGGCGGDCTHCAGSCAKPEQKNKAYKEQNIKKSPASRKRQEISLS